MKTNPMIILTCVITSFLSTSCLRQYNPNIVSTSKPILFGALSDLTAVAAISNYDDSAWLCSATFVGKRCLITAAHCMPGAQYVRVGSDVRNGAAYKRGIFGASMILLNYNASQEPLGQERYDIAVVRIDDDPAATNPINHDQDYEPLGINYQKGEVQQYAGVAGYGPDGRRREGYHWAQSNDPVYVMLPFTADPGYVCVTSGDSGGPLLTFGLDADGKEVVTSTTGVASTSTACATRLYQATYAPFYSNRDELQAMIPAVCTQPPAGGTGGEDACTDARVCPPTN